MLLQLKRFRLPSTLRALLRFRVLVLVLLTASAGTLRLPDAQELDGRICDCPSNLQTATMRGALLTTRFETFEDLKQVIDVSYSYVSPTSLELPGPQPLVRLTHCGNGRQVTSVLTTGVSQTDMKHASKGGLWKKLNLAVLSPTAVVHRHDLKGVSILARWRHDLFGWADPAFYDLAKTMAGHMRIDSTRVTEADLGEKGFINTFNHITAQALMTSLFSEEVADLVGDAHERAHMPELITGQFTAEQLADRDNGPVDNYVDMINNEWGQELGKELSAKLNITRETRWTPELLATYLNELQRYYSWAFETGFVPFQASDPLVTRFSGKINAVKAGDYSGKS